MIHGLLLPVGLLLLVVLQITLPGLFLPGGIGIPFSMIVVIYAGFHLGVLRGGLLSFLLGFFLDCLTGAIFGLHTFFYVLIFLFARTFSERVYGEKPALIALYSGFCALLEGLLIVVLYRLVFGIDILYEIPRTFVPQSLLVVLLSPFCFALLDRLGVFPHAESSKPARPIRTGTVQG